LALILNIGFALCWSQGLRGPRDTSCPEGEEVVCAPAAGHSLPASWTGTPETLSPLHRGNL